MTISKENKWKKFGPIIVVIIVVVSIIGAAILLNSWPDEKAGDDYITKEDVRISLSGSEKTLYWQVGIATKSGGNLELEDTVFKVINQNHVQLFTITINDANPAWLEKDQYQVYPMTKGSAVTDDSTGAVIDERTSFEDYLGCYIAYIDYDSNGRVSQSDYLLVYKDYDNDGTTEVTTGSKVGIFENDTLIAERDL